MIHQDPNIAGEPVDGSPDGIDFTSWKFLILDAIAHDRRVKPAEFEVAYCLIQHANAKDGAIYPSMELLALESGLSVSYVQKILDHLAELGWVKKGRPNKQETNSYAFDEKHWNAVMDQFQSQKEALNEARQKRRGRSDMHNSVRQQFLTRTRVQVPTRTRVQVPTRTIGGVNTLEEHTRGTHQKGSGIDEEGTHKGAYVPPNFDHLES